jgi:hypothetical protein
MRAPLNETWIVREDGAFHRMADDRGCLAMRPLWREIEVDLALTGDLKCDSPLLLTIRSW